MIIRLFDKQIEFAKSPARIRGAFAGKRCISPEARILTLGGLKSFGDIREQDHVLSFDQKGNQFRFSRSGYSFPKTKEIGYRVIHDRGEFVVSGQHRVLCSSGEYVSVLDIKKMIDQGNISKKDILKSFIGYSDIKSIEKVKEQWFWDIEVPGDNNYYACGAIHHNSGKTEIGAVEAVKYSHGKIGYTPSHIDPYLGVIIAPTTDMLRRLSLAKFEAYSKPFLKPGTEGQIKAPPWYCYKNDAQIIAISADKPQRLEGLKANWIWIDEVFQVSEQLFLEALARVSDTQGKIWVTGSLGTQYRNPKSHWVHRYFKEKPIDGSEHFEWCTSDNPYFPKDELIRLEETLDPKTYRQLFTIDWNAPGSNLVYDQIDESNELETWKYNPDLKTFVSIDWGWAHPMAVGFFQVDFDAKVPRVVLFDEIVSSKLTIENMAQQIISRGYRIDGWCCDIAGNQEREQTGYSNVRWFRDNLKINLKYRSSAVVYGITMVRSWIRNGLGQSKFLISRRGAPKSLDCLKNYSYPEKDGQILKEEPLKKDDDPADMIRYFFVNFMDPRNSEQTIVESFGRWEKWL